MSRIIEISNMPTIVKTSYLDTVGTHESCLRAFNILDEVKIMLSDKVSHSYILELIHEMESGEGGCWEK